MLVVVENKADITDHGHCAIAFAQVLSLKHSASSSARGDTWSVLARTRAVISRGTPTMEILLRDRTTNQPRSVYSGRGGKSIAHDGWKAKAPMAPACRIGVTLVVRNGTSC